MLQVSSVASKVLSYSVFRHLYCRSYHSTMNPSLRAANKEEEEENRKSKIKDKDSIRRAAMKELKAYAKENPAEMAALSKSICDHLYHHLDRTLPKGGVVHLCAYLPLYYEVDLTPLMRRVLEEAAWRGRVRVYVPFVLSPPPPHADGEGEAPSSELFPWHFPLESARTRLQSAMLFVQLHNLHDDLRDHFETQGRFKLLELKSSTVASLFHSPPSPSPPRSLLLCGEWSSLFPAHPPPVGLVATPETVVVLTPGVLFDHSGARLGKGGGFYDRFLQHHQRGERIGVALPSQCVNKVPMVEGEDMRVQWLATADGVHPTSPPKVVGI